MDILKPERMKLRYYPDPVLFDKGADVTEFGSALKASVRRMFEIMYESDGVGLAAHQIGWPVHLFVMAVANEEKRNAHPDKEPDYREICDEYVVINPRFVSMGDARVAFEEGCLSFPGLRAKIFRPDQVLVEALDVDGRPFQLAATGLMSRCLQHEYDHIHGLLFNRLWDGMTLMDHQNKLNEFRRAFETGATPVT